MSSIIYKYIINEISILLGLQEFPENYAVINDWIIIFQKICASIILLLSFCHPLDDLFLFLQIVGKLLGLFFKYW